MTFARETCSGFRKSGDTKMRLGPSGVHIFNRASGLNILLDESIPPKRLWSTAPRHVSIALTNTCDLSCSYCYAPKYSASLNFDQILGWLNELDQHGTIGVGFGGGEPTLYPRFAELCAQAANRTRLSISFTTHGHHFDVSLLNALRGHAHFIRVSMDGVDETYQRHRNRSFSAFKRKIAMIREFVPFGINYVVNADTIQVIDDAAAFATQAGASEFLLLPERSASGNSRITVATNLALQHWVKNFSGSIRLAVSELGSENMPICNPLFHEKGIRAYAHINAAGELKRTSYASHGIPIRTCGIMTAIRQLERITEGDKL